MEIALGPVLWGTDYIRHLHKNCKISSSIELNSAYISIHCLGHLEIRMRSFKKKQKNLVLPIFKVVIFFLRHSNGKEKL